jgi:hypothetical protein
MNDVSIESRRKSRAFRAPALFYFMVVMRAALQQNINHVKVPQFFFSFSRVSQTLDVIPSIIRPVVGHPRPCSRTVGARDGSCPGDWLLLYCLRYNATRVRVERNGRVTK